MFRKPKHWVTSETNQWSEIYLELILRWHLLLMLLFVSVDVSAWHVIHSLPCIYILKCWQVCWSDSEDVCSYQLSLCFPDLRRISWKIKRICKELSSTSAVFLLKDCNLLLRDSKDLKHDSIMSECCTTLQSRMAAAKNDSFSPNSSKGKGKQKSNIISKDFKMKVSSTFMRY